MTRDGEIMGRVAAFLDAGTLAEILDRGEASKRVLDEGREQGQIENKKRAEADRQRWRERAIELKTEKPYLLPEDLTAEVRKWCQLKNIRFKSGKSYSFRTIYDDLKKNGVF